MIGFAVYTQEDESEMKTRGLDMSPDILNSESKVGTLNSKTFESGKFCRVNASDILSLRSN